MHSSWFSYPVSRPYPFRWFTPVTIAGGVVLAVLFTLINLGSSGFYLKPEFTQDPNTTLTSGTQWFMKPPFTWENNLEPKCEPKMLSVGDRFFTTTLGFQYTVNSLRRVDEEGNTVESFPSIPYMNNTLEDCYLDKATLNLLKTDATAAPTWWVSWGTSYVDATASCKLTSQLGPVNVSLALQYSGVIHPRYEYVLVDNYTTHASMWWGTRLLNVYFTGVLQIMSQRQNASSKDDDHYWVRGELPYIQNEPQKDIRSLDFFRTATWWLASSRGWVKNRDASNISYLLEHPEHPVSAAAVEGFHFAKILHSLVAIDLGNCKALNLLLDDESLKYALHDPESSNRKSGGPLYVDGEEHIPDNRAVYSTIRGLGLTDDTDLTLLNEAYDKFRPLTGDLSCQNSTIVAQYLCSVPQSKSTGTMLLAIVIANLVFLQAAWRLLNVVSQWILPNADSQAMVCEGCLSGGLPMERISSGTRPASRDESAVQLIPG